MKKQEKTDSSEAWEFGREWFKDVLEKIKYNEYQAAYYDRMAEDYHDDLFRRKAERTRACSRRWALDYYKKHGIKQIVDIIRCNDAFCYVCQSLKAQRRFEIYAPKLKEYESKFTINHTVLTVPNVTGERLNWTLDKMSECFARLIEYLSGHKKIRGIDFEEYGYVGAVRSLEITTGKRKASGDYHPHYHCMLILRKDLNLPEIAKNSFSTKKRNGKVETTYFTKFEILLQRIWCLLMLDIRVTKKNIFDMRTATGGRYKDGFDVMSKNAEGKYHEIFKYAIKGTYKKESIFTYEEFCWLYGALKNRRVYETYGCLRKENFNRVDDVFSPTMQTDLLYGLFLEALQRCEKPVRIDSCLDEILKDFDRREKNPNRRPIRYIGPATLRRAFSGKTEEEKQEILKRMIEKLTED